MKTVRDACHLQENALSIKLSDQIEQLDELINVAGDGTQFFARTAITQGMQDVSRKIFDTAKAHAEAVLHPDRVANDLRRERISAITSRIALPAFSLSSKLDKLFESLRRSPRDRCALSLAMHSLEPNARNLTRYQGILDDLDNLIASCRIQGCLKALCKGNKIHAACCIVA